VIWEAFHGPLLFLLKIPFIYLRERAESTSGEWEERGRGRGRRDSSLNREPDVGLDPRTSRS